jgi:type II restriction enzyme
MEEREFLPYRQHLKSAADLVTTGDQVRAGFVSLALERNRQATPHVEAARALKVAASKATSPAALKDIRSIQSALVTAAGISDKAAGYMLPEDKREAIQGLIANFLEPAGAAFVEELVFRFLLTRGDTLGGTMRNIGGALAQRKLTRGLISTLTLNAIHYRWLHSASQTWTNMTEEDADIELHVCGLAWEQSGKHRTLMYNVTVPLVRNNIDLILLNSTPEEFSNAYKDPHRYIALGELKGGIDPAGADEHWKTAKTALARIRSAFEAEALNPMTFFVGAAVAKKMADEIWDDLQTQRLSNSANLTSPDQVASLCNWITQL